MKVFKILFWVLIVSMASCGSPKTSGLSFGSSPIEFQAEQTWIKPKSGPDSVEPKNPGINPDEKSSSMMDTSGITADEFDYIASNDDTSKATNMLPLLGDSAEPVQTVTNNPAVDRRKRWEENASNESLVFHSLLMLGLATLGCLAFFAAFMSFLFGGDVLFEGFGFQLVIIGVICMPLIMLVDYKRKIIAKALKEKKKITPESSLKSGVSGGSETHKKSEENPSFVVLVLAALLLVVYMF